MKYKIYPKIISMHTTDKSVYCAVCSELIANKDMVGRFEKDGRYPSSVGSFHLRCFDEFAKRMKELTHPLSEKAVTDSEAQVPKD